MTQATSDEEKKVSPRLKKIYQDRVLPEMQKRFGYKNVWEVPRLDKIVINIGVTEARENIRALEIASDELSVITGQKPMVRRAKKSISNFKLREGMPIGLFVTLRGNRMYEFLDRFISIAVPRIRDFRGLNPNAFDGRGNINLGLTEQYIFTEVDLDKSDQARGMNITMVTTADTDEKARVFLGLMGMPFRKIDPKFK